MTVIIINLSIKNQTPSLPPGVNEGQAGSEFQRKTITEDHHPIVLFFSHQLAPAVAWPCPGDGLPSPATQMPTGAPDFRPLPNGVGALRSMRTA